MRSHSCFRDGWLLSIALIAISLYHDFCFSVWKAVSCLPCYSVLLCTYAASSIWHACAFCTGICPATTLLRCHKGYSMTRLPVLLFCRCLSRLGMLFLYDDILEVPVFVPGIVPVSVCVHFCLCRCLITVVICGGYHVLPWREAWADETPSVLKENLHTVSVRLLCSHSAGSVGEYFSLCHALQPFLKVVVIASIEYFFQSGSDHQHWSLSSEL